jgi:hypothetical protein
MTRSKGTPRFGWNGLSSLTSPSVLLRRFRDANNARPARPYGGNTRATTQSSCEYFLLGKSRSSGQFNAFGSRLREISPTAQASRDTLARVARGMAMD